MNLYINLKECQNYIMKNNNDNIFKISASEVSACIGMNKYINKDIMVIKYWIKKDAKSFDEALKRNNIKKENILNIEKKNMNKKNEIYLDNYKNTIKNQENGKNNEHEIIEIYQSMKKITIKDNNKKLYSIFINNQYRNLIYHKIIVQGLIDGIVEDKDDKYIIEIKDRQYKIFNEIPEYELIQIIIYMVITKIYKCKHIQRYKEKIKAELIIFNINKWNEIEKKIVEFIDYFEKIYFIETFQDIFLKNVLKNKEINKSLASKTGIVLENL